MKKILLLIFLVFNIHVSYSKILEKYEIRCDSTLIEKSREILKQQVGIKELTGHNDGPEVEKYLHSVGLSKGSAWCQALQYYCYWLATKILGLSEDMIPIPKTGLANNVYLYAKKHGKKVDFEAKIDDFIIYRLNNSTIHGHIARTIAVGQKGRVTTIEGNTSNGLSGNQSEGNGCFQKQRNIYHPLSRMYIKALVGIKKESD